MRMSPISVLVDPTLDGICDVLGLGIAVRDAVGTPRASSQLSVTGLGFDIISAPTDPIPATHAPTMNVRRSREGHGLRRER